MLASLLLMGAIVFVGLGTGVAASTAPTALPVGSTSTFEDGSESKLDASTRRAAAHRAMSQSAVGGDFEATSGPVAVERLLVRWFRLAPPSWRGPPVLLI